MRSFLVAFTGLMLLATGAAQAKIAITVDKNAQLMTVAVDGVQRYQWPVSTGNPSAYGCRAPTLRRSMRWWKRKACSTPA
jgi:hypothetical protein